MNNLDNYGCAGGMRCKAPGARMAIPCKRPATPQRARQCSQNVRVIHGQPLSLDERFRDYSELAGNLIQR
ncbi:MAG: hypothetical protein Q8Q28_15385 [Pseudomonadota bacterium]|nr:hypothetical protein [Pseudomonadota bacterium]